MRKTLAFLVAGMSLALPGCTAVNKLRHSGNYQVREHISEGRQKTISDKNALYKLKVFGLYGRNYCAQKCEESATGFALVPYDSISELINDNGKRNGLVGLFGLLKGTVKLERKEAYWAVPAKTKDRKIVTRVNLATKGKFAIKAVRKPLKTFEDLGVQETTGAQYKIKTLVIGPMEAYFPHNPEGEKTKDMLNFDTIPLQGHKRLIKENGQVTLINPGKIYEWIRADKIKKQRAEAEAKRKAAEEAAKPKIMPGSITEKSSD